jgi:cysteine-rich repeat protein
MNRPYHHAETEITAVQHYMPKQPLALSLHITLVFLLSLIPAVTLGQATLLSCPPSGNLIQLNPLLEPYDALFGAEDDGSIRYVLPGTIFSDPITVGDESYGAIFINVNGNISLGQPNTSGDPVIFPAYDFPLIAPFLANIDLRNSALGASNPGKITLCEDNSNQLLTITWTDVSLFSALSATAFDNTNSFQVVLQQTDTACIVGETPVNKLEIEFRYETLTWYVGADSGGMIDGLCPEWAVVPDLCAPAVSGIDFGDGLDSDMVSSSMTLDILNALLTESNVDIPGVWRWELEGGRLPLCGDSIRTACESCDDGGDSFPCDADCTFVACGDGYINPVAGEMCDDGELNDDTMPDACRTNCQEATCGDGITDSTEFCDRSGIERPTCDGDCSEVFCGDGYTNPTAEESCDPGDTDTFDCNLDCSEALCGDSYLNTAASESCDNGSLNSDTEPDACRTDCQLAHCGDGVTDIAELCDDGPLNSDETPDACRTDCQTASCGDSIVDTDEGCDDGAVSTASCDLDCTPVWCGDAILNTPAGEECDDGLLNSDLEPDACRTDCTFPSCGDSVPDSAEDCDEGGIDTVDCDMDCSIAVCGDGYLNLLTGEVCDNGIDNSDIAPDACRTICLPPSCGDFVIDEGESCDTGEESPSCNGDCSLSICGDGLLNLLSGEACDNGDENSDLLPDSCRTNCQPPWCGDGVIDEGEPCDPGLETEIGCYDDCVLPRCGDGIIAGTEICDDANITIDDGCDNQCFVESGWECDTNEPSLCYKLPVCGDGQVDEGESCDDSNLSNEDGCDNDCLIEAGWECSGLAPSICTPLCGNGTLEDDEFCDDGNRTNDDGCSAYCTIEEGWICTGEPSDCSPEPRCGDGQLSPEEDCDDGNELEEDGCSSACLVEEGWICTGSNPSTCEPDPNIDTDNDGTRDSDDNCPFTVNPNQTDRDFDSIGDACDPDVDGDGYLNENDAAPYDALIHRAEEEGCRIVSKDTSPSLTLLFLLIMAMKRRRD